MKTQSIFPTGQQLSSGMAKSDIKINGMKVLFDEKVTLMPVKTASIRKK